MYIYLKDLKSLIKNLIPKILEDQKAMFAYPFKGYWRDVGTIQSLWDANMDLIKTDEANIKWKK